MLWFFHQIFFLLDRFFFHKKFFYGGILNSKEKEFNGKAALMLWKNLFYEKLVGLLRKSLIKLHFEHTLYLGWAIKTLFHIHYFPHHFLQNSDCDQPIIDSFLHNLKFTCFLYSLVKSCKFFHILSEKQSPFKMAIYFRPYFSS